MSQTSARPWVRVIHGPNLNLLGEREPEIYGARSLNALNTALRELAAQLDVELDLRQSNHEGQIIDWVQECRQIAGERSAGLIINPAGYTHTSVAIQDAIRGVSLPVIEVHLSNIYSREALRHSSVTGVACAGVIMGFGFDSYLLALKHLAAALTR